MSTGIFNKIALNEKSALRAAEQKSSAARKIDFYDSSSLSSASSLPLTLLNSSKS